MKLPKILVSATALLTGTLLLASSPPPHAAGKTQRYLYVASPGIRNYVEYGGVGVLVFDRDDNYRFVKRIPTFPVVEEKPAENVKGVCASAKTGKLYVSTPQRLLCLDLLTEKPVWEKVYEGGCDRMSLSPDGKVMYLPSFEGPHWNAVDAETGNLLAKVVTHSGAHNTVYGADGKRVYMGGLKSPMLFVADTRSHQVTAQVGPFSGSIRPFTINRDQSLAFVCVNGLLGFEIGDLKSGKMIHRVEVQGYQQGPIKRHGCPSHGVGLTPDEKEVWVVDASNERVHIFDNQKLPPRQVASLKLRDQPGWVTFSLDGKHAYPSTGEIIDTKTRRIVATLTDETGRPVHSEKVLEIHFRDGKPVRAGDQFGIGRR